MYDSGTLTYESNEKKKMIRLLTKFLDISTDYDIQEWKIFVTF